MSQTHGGKRNGAGRPQIVTQQITVGVDESTMRAINDFKVDENSSIADAVRSLVTFSARPTIHLDGLVYARFAPLADSDIDGDDEHSIEAAFEAVCDVIRPNLNFIYAFSAPTANTLKGRLPVPHTGTDIYPFVQNIRGEPPSAIKKSYDRRLIVNALGKLGVKAQWSV